MTAERFEVDVAACRPSPAARPVQDIHVEILAKSIKDVGLIQPISVRPVAGGFEVIAGMHRLKAFEKLGRITIPAVVRHDDDLRAELALIDENLCRNELSPAARALAISRRKTIYEALHPETAHGGDRRSSRQPGDLKSEMTAPAATEGEADADVEPPPQAERFTKATAEATGQSERAIQRDAQRGHVGEGALARIVGTSLDKGEEIDALAKLSPERREEVIAKAEAGEKVSAKVAVKQERREDREEQLADKIIALPTKKYAVIVSDDEWDHEVWSRTTGMDRHAANHYEVADDAHTAAELHERTKARFECAADDCFLGMWVTVQHLAVGIDLLRLRGFRYVSHYVWGKDKIGLGYWNRNKHEVLLIGIKGDIPCPAPGTQWPSLIMAERGEHSAKPECFLEMIEAYFPNLPKMEFNRRGPPRPGWDAWGNEAEAPADTRVTDDQQGDHSARLEPIEPADSSADHQAQPSPAIPSIEDADLDIPDFLRRAP